MKGQFAKKYPLCCLIQNMESSNKQSILRNHRIERHYIIKLKGTSTTKSSLETRLVKRNFKKSIVMNQNCVIE